MKRNPGVLRSSIRFFAAAALAAAAQLPSLARADELAPAPTQVPDQDAPAPGGASTGMDQEVKDRVVDSAANSTQKFAIKMIREQIQRDKGSPREPLLLVRLADLQDREAETLFRVIHAPGPVQGAKQQLTIQAHEDALNGELETLNQFLEKYPNLKDSERMMFMRAKAYRELGKASESIREFNAFAARYPKSQYVPLAHVFAAEMAIEAQDYNSGIRWLTLALATQDKQQYSYVLEKLAECHYMLNQMPEAMKNLEQLVAFERKRMAEGKHKSTDLERALMSATIYYATAMEKKLPGFSVAEAFPYFRKLDGGPYLGKMMANFATGLRAKGLEQELIAWKEVVIKQGSAYPESFGTLYTVYEALVNWRRQTLLLSMPKDLNSLKARSGGFADDPSYPKFRKLLVDTMEKFNAFLSKNPAEGDRISVSAALTAVYNSFLHMVDKKDPLRPKVIFRLAEHYFTLKEYEKATQLYVWIAEGREKTAEADLIKQSKLRAIASRYEFFLADKLIPQELAVKAFKEVQPGKLTAAFNSWVSWIDAYPDPNEKTMENFEFEANRSLYFQGHLKPALARLVKFVEKRPKSKYTIPSASLVLDTYVASEAWQDAYDTSMKFLKMPGWDKPEFVAKLGTLASDSYFKLVEGAYRAKQYAQSLAYAQKYVAQWPKGPHALTSVGFAGASALELKQIPLALSYFTTVIEQDPKSEFIGSALMVRAMEAEKRFDFAAAARDYTKLVALPSNLNGMDESHANEVRKKILYLALLTESPADLGGSLRSAVVCPAGMRTDCERYEDLSRILYSGSKPSAGDARNFARMARSSRPDLGILQAALALQSADALSDKEQSAMVQLVSNQWASQDPIFKYALIPTLTSSIPTVYSMARAKVFKSYRLPPNPNTAASVIKRRVGAIKAVESSASGAISLPWAKVKALVLNEMSGMYYDLANDVRHLLPTQGLKPEEKATLDQVLGNLAQPFEQQGQQIRVKAFELASDGGVEEPVIAKFMPAGSGKLPTSAVAGYLLSPQIMAKIDPFGGWAQGFKDKTDESSLVKANWLAALSKRHWPRVAFFVQRAQESAGLGQGVGSLMKAASLSTIGAQAEGVTELKSASEKLLGMSKAKAQLALASHYFASSSKTQSQTWLMEFSKGTALRENWFYEDAEAALAYGASAHWANVAIDSGVLGKLKAAIATNAGLGANPWAVSFSQWDGKIESKLGAAPTGASRGIASTQDGGQKK